jgi:hypothetical protein
VVRAELHEYASATPFEADYSNLHSFTGTVTAYNENRDAISVGIFDNGDNPACPPPPGGTPGEGGGGPGGSPSGPGGGPDPYNPLPGPNWPGSGSGNGDDGCWEIVTAGPEAENPAATIGWLNNCTNTFYEIVDSIQRTEKITAHCNDGSGVIILPGKPETPCELTKKTLENPKVQDGIANLKDFLETAAAEKNEQGFKEDFNGEVTATPGGEYYTNSGPAIGNYGIYHVHPNGLDNIHIFSATDITRLLEYALVQIPSHNVEKAYSGMIAKEPCASCPSGFKYIHYVIRFTGTHAQLQNLPLSQMQNNIKKWKADQAVYESEIKSQYQNNPPNGFINHDGLEKVFFNTQQNMGLQNLITLQRVDENNNIYNITQNGDGSLNSPSLCK